MPYTRPDNYNPTTGSTAPNTGPDPSGSGSFYTDVGNVLNSLNQLGGATLANPAVGNITPDMLSQLGGLTSLFGPGLQATTDIANYNIGELSNQQALAQGQLGIGTREAQQNYGFEQQLLGLQGKQLGIDKGAIARQIAEAQFQAGQQTRAERSSATARGAINTSGFAQNLQDINTQLGFRMADIEDRKKALDIAGQQLGISGQEAKARLQNTLDRLNLSTRISVDNLADEIRKVQAGLPSQLLNQLAPLFAGAGLGPFGIGPASGTLGGPATSYGAQ